MHGAASILLMRFRAAHMLMWQDARGSKHLVDGVYSSCVEKYALGKRGFARVYVRRDSDIAEVSQVVSLLCLYSGWHCTEAPAFQSSTCFEVQPPSRLGLTALSVCQILVVYCQTNRPAYALTWARADSA